MTMRKSNPYLTLVNSYTMDSPQPTSMNYWWNLGSLTGLCTVMQMASGTFTAMHYSSNMELAFNSVEHIMRDVNAGWLIRYMHANGASFFFMCLYMHMGKALYYGSYKTPRVLVWSVGVVIFILTMATAFMGYCLVYGQMSHWGATVMTNLLSAMPFIGGDLMKVIWGGFSVSNPTMQRFFALHFLLPFILAALVVMHFMALHVHGSSNPLGMTGNMDRVPMHGYFVFKDLITVFVFLLVFSLFVFFSPNTTGQRWPLLLMLLMMSQCAMCLKYFKYYKMMFVNYNKTINMSDLFLIKFKYMYFFIKSYANPLMVKYYYNEYNKQMTKMIMNSFYNLLVGISETMRTQKMLFTRSFYSNHNNNHNLNIKFNQWLAGLIDGDGYLGMTNKKYSNCEITVGTEDEKLLRIMQNKFGGSIKLRSNSNSIRYRLQNKLGMINLVNAINGNIRNSKRLTQLYQVCDTLNMNVMKPIKLDINNSYISGFFDADGTINFYYQNNRPQLYISITNKYLMDLDFCKEMLGGEMYFDKSQNGYYKWVMTNETNHINFYNYMRNNPGYSHKMNKVYLMPLYYKHYNAKTYMKKETLLYKSWLKFETKWKNYDYKFK
uniref:Cytochrome b n=1 Tax=Pichia sorbitophila (strain ATCC MYA-4447 / BCRC 22081 / CBS 7064 / NBRC 10061 / NRRL Y-12695) TaxID=559304 RepID=C7U017_PICSO|nr:endonuclease [Millerozyma farinosa]CAY39273.1 Endonuclease, COB group I intron encoded [Millerozyma farinosa]